MESDQRSGQPELLGILHNLKFGSHVAKGIIPPKGTFLTQLNLHWVQQKSLCHFNLGNPMDVEERLLKAVAGMDVLPLSAQTGEAGTEMASPPSKERRPYPKLFPSGISRSNAMVISELKTNDRLWNHVTVAVHNACSPNKSYSKNITNFTSPDEIPQAQSQGQKSSKQTQIFLLLSPRKHANPNKKSSQRLTTFSDD
ncbi:hypothetical protein J6590_041512 [Homalodisca vitripennis]|nr:hypothetical protein J6590_041512 [Homalodisca vitripennis]